MRLRHQRRLAVAMTAMVVVSTVSWLPLGIAPLALMMGRAAQQATESSTSEGRWLLLVEDNATIAPLEAVKIIVQDCRARKR